jgi:hypothetical protein
MNTKYWLGVVLASLLLLCACVFENMAPYSFGVLLMVFFCRKLRVDALAALLIGAVSVVGVVSWPAWAQFRQDPKFAVPLVVLFGAVCLTGFYCLAFRPKGA